MCCFEFCFMFNSCNTLIAQFRLIRFGFVLFTIHMMRIQIFNSMWCMDHVLFNSRTQINVDCHMLQVQACWFCIDLDRTGYHAVDAGFWVVLELVIRWTRVRFNLIDLSSLAMFVPSSRNPIRLYNHIRQFYHEWNVFISLFLTMYAFSLPRSDCIMRWIDLILVGGVVSNKLYHAVD
jgi:hypothetical protein